MKKSANFTKYRCFLQIKTHSPAQNAGLFQFIIIMPYDLFGEIPVTEDDIFMWVQAIAPRWLTPERSYRNYVRTWNIADKVRAAKLSGQFDAIIARPSHAYHARLALASII